MKHCKTQARKWYATLAAFMLACALACVGMAFTQADEAWADASSWSDIRSQVSAGGDVEITINGSFPYDGKSIVIPSGKSVTIKGSGTIHSKTLGENESYESMFKVENGGKLTIENDVTLSGKIGDNGQTCPDGATYTADKFTGELTSTDYNPKGFFIQVEDGGSATLKGTISDFVTSRSKADTPRYVAPVVANGANATFNIEGGTIKNNLVGYIVDDGKANTNASQIRAYVKGTGPNVPRIPNAQTQKANRSTFDRPRNTDAGIDAGSPGSGLTGTAGAVIYKGGAQGTITNAVITNNRADTGGIMVSGDGTQVTVGQDTTDTTVFSKNVGVQFGGGSTAEQGGTITMMGGTFRENVAWFGGGAVYATENGTAWLMGLMNGADGLHPQFDDRLDGKFEMFGGELTENTGLTRGGAILADSDGVQINKGKLTNNMARMLGGAVYVMGDHPQYTYTMHLTGLYVHNNTAVSGVVPGDKAAENALLQTKLSAPTTCPDTDPGDLLSGTISGNTDDMNDGTGTHGTGGGVWLCAYGNTVFSAGSTDKVVIADNYATGTAPLSSSAYSNYIKTGNDANAQKVRADINYNSAPSTSTPTGKTGGNDIHADTGDVGTVIIDDLDPTRGDWYDENSSSPYGTTVSDSRINLINNGTNKTMSNPAVEISGNIARRGGGLAADGTYILGPVGDQATVEAGMGVAKEWAASTPRKPITMHVTATDGTHTANVADVPLDGIANPPASEFDTVEELAPTQSTWNGHFVLPLSLVAEDGTKMPVFIFHVTYPNVVVGDTPENIDQDIDPMSFEGRKILAAVIKQVKKDNTDGEGNVDQEAVLAALKSAIKISFNNNLSFALTEYEMEEVTDTETGITYWQVKTEGGNPVVVNSHVFTQKEINLNEVAYSLTSTPHTEKVWDADKGKFVEQEIFQAHIFGVNLVLPASNDNKPIVEKYVNKDVHSNIVNYDQEFTYDILAYVPTTATEFTITDKLVEGLEFADKDGNPSDDPWKVVYAVAVKYTNNHEVGEEGTAASGAIVNTPSGTPIEFIRWEKGFPADEGWSDDVVGKSWPNQGYGPQMSIEGDTLTIKIDEVNNNPFDLQQSRGRWVQVTFFARIKDEYRNLDALKALRDSWANTDSDKQGDPAYDVSFANGDLLYYNGLMALIGEDPITWAVEAPSHYFARSSRGDYYYTENGKDTGTWKLIPESDPFWTNANNRYTGQGAEGHNTVRVLDINGEDAELVAPLKEMPRVKGAQIVKGAEGTTRIFLEVRNVEGQKEIWYTDDKAGAVEWTKAEPGTGPYINGEGRLKPDKLTIRMLDFTSGTIEIPGDGKNWPVLSEEEHEGMKNQAGYNVKFGNNAEGTYKSNTVTVMPETTELDVVKKWADEWPKDVENVTFGIYAVKGDVEKAVYVKGGKVVGCFEDGDTNIPDGAEKLEVVLKEDNPATTDNESKVTVKDLPKLKGTTYLAREIKVGDKDVTFANAEKTVGNVKLAEGNDVFVALSSIFENEKFVALIAEAGDDKPINGAEDSEGLYAMTVGGEYWSTTDLTGKTGWTKLTAPASDEDESDAAKLYRKTAKIFARGDANIEPFDLKEVYTALNSKVTTEKYVENKVHADLDAFDKEFTYSVMGFVPEAATKVVLSDELTKDLLFVESDLDKVIASVAAYKDNDHVGDGTGTVSKTEDDSFIAEYPELANNTRQKEKAVDERDYKIELTGKTLKLTLDEGFLNEVRATDKVKGATDKSFWIKMTFKAKINPDSYTDLAEKIADPDDSTVTDPDGIRWEKVTDDKTVINGADCAEDGSHAGLLNKAKYQIFVGNEGTSEYETNTVTVKPTPLKTSVEKKWNGADGEEIPWPAQVESVTVEVTYGNATHTESQTLTLTADKPKQETKEFSRLSDAEFTISEVSKIDGFIMGAPTGDAASGFEITNQVEGPEIEKYVAEAVHKEIDLDEEFTYDILAYVTSDADTVTITDTLDKQLQFVSTASDVVVVYHDDDNHKPRNDVQANAIAENGDATVCAEGTPVEGADITVNEESRTLTVAVGVDDIAALRGKWVQVTFKAKIADGLTLTDLEYTTIDPTEDEDRAAPNTGNAPVLSDEGHAGVPNKASYTIGVENAPGVIEDKYEDESNTVTVKPKAQPTNVVLWATKALEDENGTKLAPAADAFTFQLKLTDPNGAVTTQEASNSEEEGTRIRFDVTGLEAPGEYKYEVTEIAGSDETIAYDTSVLEGSFYVAEFILPTRTVLSTGSKMGGLPVIMRSGLASQFAFAIAPAIPEDTANGATFERILAVVDKATYDSYEGKAQKIDSRDDLNGIKLETVEVGTFVNKKGGQQMLSAEASSATKRWADGGNTKDRKPVDFQLWRKVGETGEWELVEGKKLTLTEEHAANTSEWTGRFDNLPAYENGELISYRVIEANSGDFSGLYTPDSDEQIVVVDTNSKTGMGGTNHPNTPNAPIDIVVSKKAVGATAELKGAKLQVLDADGNVAKDGNGESLEWTTTDKPHTLPSMPVGLYKLHEAAAPNGYNLAEDIQFRVNVDGTVEVYDGKDWKAYDDKGIVMYDQPSTNKKTTTATTPKTSASKSTAKTGDDAGMATAGFVLLAMLSAAVVAVTGRRAFGRK